MGIEGDTRKSFLCREHGQFTAMVMGFLGPGKRAKGQRVLAIRKPVTLTRVTGAR